MNESLFSFLTASRSLTPALFTFAYFLGAIPFGLLVARVFHVKNISTKGSGNIGATNVSRVAGFWPAGLITFLLDFGKGFLATFLATPVGVHSILTLLGSPDAGTFEAEEWIAWAAGFFAVLGHCFSPFFHFKGGKGVATTCGVMVLLAPIPAAFGILGFGLTFFHRRIASLASIVGVVILAAATLVLSPTGIHHGVGAAILFLVLMRHEKNIDALLENREPAFRK